MESEITRTEIVKLTAKLVLLSAFSYYSMKWLLNQIDPTNKQKNKAKEKVIFQLPKPKDDIVKDGLVTNFEVVRYYCDTSCFKHMCLISTRVLLQKSVTVKSLKGQNRPWQCQGKGCVKLLSS